MLCELLGKVLNCRCKCSGDQTLFQLFNKTHKNLNRKKRSSKMSLCSCVFHLIYRVSTNTLFKSAHALLRIAVHLYKRIFIFFLGDLNRLIKRRRSGVNKDYGQLFRKDSRVIIYLNYRKRQYTSKECMKGFLTNGNCYWWIFSENGYHTWMFVQCVLF